MLKNYGFQNEIDFVEYFNDKFIYELDKNSQAFLKELFDFNIDDSEKIKSWKNKVNQKADIFIKYKFFVKRVSLKCGNSNSMHSEQIQDFKLYLEKMNVPYKVIDKYVSFHYGYKRDADGHLDFSKSLSGDEYKELYQDEIDVFNNYINKTKIIVDMIDRFIVRGRNSEYDIDALVCGTVEDYVWIMKYDLYDLILSQRCLEYTSPHIACLTIGPSKRNLNHDSKNSKDRYIVRIRWHFIRESIIEFRARKVSLVPASIQKEK